MTVTMKGQTTPQHIEAVEHQALDAAPMTARDQPTAEARKIVDDWFGSTRPPSDLAAKIDALAARRVAEAQTDASIFSQSARDLAEIHGIGHRTAAIATVLGKVRTEARRAALEAAAREIATQVERNSQYHVAGAYKWLCDAIVALIDAPPVRRQLNDAEIRMFDDALFASGKIIGEVPPAEEG
jgi:hypothetical protein